MITYQTHRCASCHQTSYFSLYSVIAIVSLHPSLHVQYITVLMNCLLNTTTTDHQDIACYKSVLMALV